MNLATRHATDSHRAHFLAAFSAVLRREFRAALLNRYLQLFSALALGGGIAAVATSETEGAAPFFLLHVSLYFVSLFALLVGVSAARAESEEWPILFTQPVPRWVCAIGKFVALTATFSVIVTLLFAPALVSEGVRTATWQLAAQTLGIAALFGSVGLCAGFIVRDRVQGLIISVSAWLLFLFGTDVIALLAAQWAPLQKAPDLWVALLMCNPLDAFRIHALFALEQIPAEAANKTALANWWLTHTGLWMTILSTAWIAFLLFAMNRRLARAEI
jgi:ABC-type transport system involved in multi-copper enzyme maturation permease subunit